MAKEKSAKLSALRCPTCGTLVLRDDVDFPFCSDRCRIIDLGKWTSGAYRISSPILDPEVLEGLDDMHRSGHNSGDDE
ncbi:MAG: DNA gyrase inhibitor YacG [Acidobacteriaceae bacterium]